MDFSDEREIESSYLSLRAHIDEIDIVNSSTTSGDGCEATMILPGLYLGANDDARCVDAINRRGYTHILNMSGVSSPPLNVKRLIKYRKIVYKAIRCLDNAKQDMLSNGFWDEATKFIEIALTQESEKKKRILVHCGAGASRSAAAVVAYLLRYRSMGLFDAFDIVRSRRPVVYPNAGFLKQLCIYERRLSERQ